jgi:hypothetical protein
MVLNMTAEIELEFCNSFSIIPIFFYTNTDLG